MNFGSAGGGGMYGGFGGGGGGFGGPHNMNNNGTPAGDTPQQQKWGDGSILPMSVAEMKRATQEHPDASFFAYGKQLSRVVLVGRVMKKADATSNLQVLVEDGSGAIDVHLYVDEAGGGDDLKAQIHEGAYVKVIGILRSFADKRSVKASRILLVTDFDEVTHHNLAVMVAIKSLQHGGATGGGAPTHFGAGAGAATSSAYGAPGGGVKNGAASGGSLEQNVLAVISANTEEAGASVQSICDALRLGQADVRRAIEALATDGHVYSTIDDDHYKGCN